MINSCVANPQDAILGNLLGSSPAGSSMRFSCIFSALALFVPSPALAADPVDYLRDVKPILRERCFSCHGALKQKGKLRLDSVTTMVERQVIKGGDAAG